MSYYVEKQNDVGEWEVLFEEESAYKADLLMEALQSRNEVIRRIQSNPFGGWASNLHVHLLNIELLKYRVAWREAALAHEGEG